MDETTTTLPSILEEDLSNVDTSMPVIAANPPILHAFDLADVTIQSKDDGSQSVKITAKTTTELRSTKGDMISAGWPLYSYIGLTERVGRPGKEDYTKDDIQRGLASFVLAVTGKKEKFGDPKRFVGMKVYGRIKIKKGTDEYPGDSNSVTFVPAPGKA